MSIVRTHGGPCYQVTCSGTGNDVCIYLCGKTGSETVTCFNNYVDLSGYWLFRLILPYSIYIFLYDCLSYLKVAAWSPDGLGIYIRSLEHSIHGEDTQLWHLQLDLCSPIPKLLERLPLGFGTADAIAIDTHLHFIIGRHTLDTPIRQWKGYQGIVVYFP